MFITTAAAAVVVVVVVVVVVDDDDDDDDDDGYGGGVSDDDDVPGLKAELVSRLDAANLDLGKGSEGVICRRPCHDRVCADTGNAISPKPPHA